MNVTLPSLLTGRSITTDEVHTSELVCLESVQYIISECDKCRMVGVKYWVINLVSTKHEVH